MAEQKDIDLSIDLDKFRSLGTKVLVSPFPTNLVTTKTVAHAKAVGKPDLIYKELAQRQALCPLTVRADCGAPLNLKRGQTVLVEFSLCSSSFGTQVFEAQPAVNGESPEDALARKYIILHHEQIVAVLKD